MLLPVPGMFWHEVKPVSTLNTKPKPQKHDPYLLIEGMACLVDGACQPLCQVMFLEASCHAYVSGMRTCITLHAELVYAVCKRT